MGFLEDSGLEEFNKTLGCQLKQSNTLLKSTLQQATRVTQFACETRKDAIQFMKRFPPELKKTWTSRFKRLVEIEESLSSFLIPESDDLKDLQNDALAQISFQDDIFRSLNAMPFVLLVMVLFKVWAVPAMAICTPIIAWIIPYIFLKFMYKLPISPEQYADIMKVMWAGSPMTVLNGGRIQAPDMLSPRSILQTIFMVFSFIQSLVQPIQNAMHLYKTDKTVYSKGTDVIELIEIYNNFKSDCEANGIYIFVDERKEIHFRNGFFVGNLVQVCNFVQRLYSLFFQKRGICRDSRKSIL